MIDLTKPVRRYVETRRAGTQVMEISRSGVRFRDKGSPRWMGPISWDAIYVKCAEIEAEALRRENAELRKARRKGRA